MKKSCIRSSNKKRHNLNKPNTSMAQETKGSRKSLSSTIQSMLGLKTKCSTKDIRPKKVHRELVLLLAGKSERGTAVVKLNNFFV